MNDPSRPLSSPCIGVCMLDADGLCMGCHRSIGEISRWAAMAEEERRRLVDEELPRRGMQRTA